MKNWVFIYVFSFTLFGQSNIAAQSAPLTVDDCIEMALSKNKQRAIAQTGLQIAHARIGQARSAYWPQVTTNALAMRLDEDPLFVFPEETDTYTITDLLPQPIVTNVTIPQKNIKLLDKNLFSATANLTLPLYTGGLRSGYMRQAHAGLTVAQQEIRRTDQHIIYEVRRLYYATVLATRLSQIAQETVNRLSATLSLTEGLYLRGSGKVKKTDYLQNKIFVESVRGMQTRLQNQANNAQTALVFYLGLSHDTQVTLSETDIPTQQPTASFNDLLNSALRFNPTWLTLHAGLEATEGKIQESKSEMRPRLALLGNLEYITNTYNQGIVPSQNKRAWQIGLGLEVPLFNGFRTRHKVNEAKAQLTQLEHKKILLHDGLAVQIKVLYQKLLAIQQHIASAQTALEAAQENHQLTELGYQAELLEIQDLIEAQITEAIIEAQYHTVCYDHYQTRIQIEKLIGTEIERLLNE